MVLPWSVAGKGQVTMLILSFRPMYMIWRTVPESFRIDFSTLGGVSLLMAVVMRLVLSLSSLKVAANKLHFPKDAVAASAKVMGGVILE